MADAMADRRKAEREATDQGVKLHDQQLRQIGALGRAKAVRYRVAEEYRKNLVQSTDLYRKGAGKATVVTGRLSEQPARGRANAEAYADKLRELATSLGKGHKNLKETARLAALLSDAWGRVVSLPSAKSFVARFKVISTVEEHRQEMSRPRAAGGPVTKGAPYIVGEYRPEIFVPSESGRIVPRVPQATALAAAAVAAMW